MCIRDRVYAIYIHEEEDVKLPYIYTLHEGGMTSPNSHNIQYAMNAHKHVCKYGDKHANKHKTKQILFLLFAKQNIYA